MTIRQLKEAIDKVCANQDQDVMFTFVVTEHAQGADDVYDKFAEINEVKRRNNVIILSQ